MFNIHIKEFNDNIIALRDFVKLIEPILNEKREVYSEKVNSLLMSGLIADYKIKNAETLEHEELLKLSKLEEKINSDIEKFYNAPITVTLGPQEDKNEKTIKIKIKAQKDLPIENDIENANKLNKHINLLFKTSLISLISSVEWMFSQILHFYYDKFPDAAGLSKQTLTLTELKSFGSVKDAEKYLIDEKIESVLRGNFESWIKILKEEIKLGLSYLSQSNEQIIEIFQRRNLYVHNGGIVNSIYFSKVHENLRLNIKMGEDLGLDKKYLENAIDLLQVQFILIASELWKKLDNKDEKRGEILIEIVYDNLINNKWEIAESICTFLIKDQNLDPVEKTISQLNYWLCKKRLNKLNEIKEQIDSADFSDKKQIFQLALFSIRDQKKEFFELLPLLFDSKEVSIKQFEEFPIFSDMRELEEYTKFKATSKHFIEIENNKKEHNE